MVVCEWIWNGCISAAVGTDIGAHVATGKETAKDYTDRVELAVSTA